MCTGQIYSRILKFLENQKIRKKSQVFSNFLETITAAGLKQTLIDS